MRFKLALDFATNYCHRVTNISKRSDLSSRQSLSGAERQRRYRQRRAMCSIDISGATAERLAALRAKKSWSNDVLISEALRALEAGRQTEPNKPKPSSGDVNKIYKIKTEPPKMHAQPKPDIPKQPDLFNE